MTSHPEMPPPSAPPSSPRRSSRSLLVIGLIVGSIGIWLLLDALGVPVPDLGRHWPLFLILGGVGSLLDYLILSRRPAALGLGVFGLGLGVLGYFFSLRRVGLTEVADWGPAIPLVIGLALIATWAVDRMRHPSHLTVGVVGLGLAATGWGWRILRTEILWAALLLGLGAYFVWRAVRQSRAERD